MLYLSPTLCTAHFYKEDFLRILDCKDRDSAKAALSEWINCAFDCGIERFKKCAQTMINWMTGILNSFSTPVTNGFIVCKLSKKAILHSMQILHFARRVSISAFVHDTINIST